MKTLVLAFSVTVAGGALVGSAAYACDCQKNQQEQAKGCTCGAGQSCPGECQHAEPPKTEKKKTKKS